MKKVLLLCFAFVFTNSFYAQEVTTKKKPIKVKTEKVDPAIAKAETEKKAKQEATNEKRKATIAAKKEASAQQKANTDKEAKKQLTADKRKTIAPTAKTKKSEQKLKETKEKAPKVADKATGEHNGKKVFTGPKGGKYYINKNGNKTYIE